MNIVAIFRTFILMATIIFSSKMWAGQIFENYSRKLNNRWFKEKPLEFVWPSLEWFVADNFESLKGFKLNEQEVEEDLSLRYLEVFGYPIDFRYIWEGGGAYVHPVTYEWTLLDGNHERETRYGQFVSRYIAEKVLIRPYFRQNKPGILKVERKLKSLKLSIGKSKAWSFKPRYRFSGNELSFSVTHFKKGHLSYVHPLSGFSGKKVTFKALVAKTWDIDGVFFDETSEHLLGFHKKVGNWKAGLSFGRRVVNEEHYQVTYFVMSYKGF